MKKWVFIFGFLGFFFLFTNQVRAAGWEQLLQKIYTEAKKEGEVIFNSERQEEVGGKEGVDLFQKRFPGIKVTFTGMAGTTLPSRLLAENKAGRVSIDAFRSDPVRAEPIKDILMAVDPKDISEHAEKTFFNDRFYKISDHITNFACNTDRVPAAERPKKYEDLLNPKWQNRLILDARGGQIGHLLAFNIWTKEKFWDFVKALKKQNPLWTSRNTEAMAKLTAGEGYIGTGSYAAIEELKKQGAPVEFLFLSPALAQVRGVAIPKACAHPNAAKLFLGWLLSPEGAKATDKYYVAPIAPGTNVYEKVRAAGATIAFEDSFDKTLARDNMEEEITKEWRALK